MLKSAQIIILSLLLAASASAATIDCDNCSDCTSKIQNASIGDTVRLTTNLSDCDCTCITFDQPGGVIFDGMGHTIAGTGAIGTCGILLPAYTDDCTILNCTITNFDEGMYLYEASRNTIRNITSYDNDDCGINILYGSENEIYDCCLPENGYYDFYFRPHPIDDCNTTVENVTGTNGLPIGYYCGNITLSDLEFAVLILCDADGATLHNITITGSDAHYSNGLRMYGTDNATLTDITSSNNFCGISIEESSNNTLRNVTCDDCWHYNIYMSYGSGNWLENITVSHSHQAGIYLNQAHNNTLTGITAYHNPFGIKLDRSMYVVVNDSVITNNTIAGVSVAGSGSTENWIYNNYFDNDNDVNIGTGANGWNVANRTGPNIIGGPYIGGNYWASRTGVIDDNQDGFGDEPFMIDGSDLNIDNLTLCYLGTPQMYIRNSGYDLEVGDVWEYLVTCRNASGYDCDCENLTWNSSNETVGVVSNSTEDRANFTALAAGTTNITVTGMGMSDTIMQNVSKLMMCGDVDDNGYVSANDVVEAYYRAVDPEYPLANEWGADADGNGYISANDVVEIYQKAVDPEHVLNCIPIT